MFTMCLIMTSVPSFDVEVHGKFVPTFRSFRKAFTEGDPVMGYLVSPYVTFGFRLDKLMYGKRGLAELRRKIHSCFVRRGKLKRLGERVRPSGRVKFVRALEPDSVKPDTSYEPPPPRKWGADRRTAGQDYTRDVVGTRLENPLLSAYLAAGRVTQFRKAAVPLPLALLPLIRQSPFLKALSTTEHGLVLRRPKEVLKMLPLTRVSGFELAGYLHEQARVGPGPVTIPTLAGRRPFEGHISTTGLGNQNFGRDDPFYGPPGGDPVYRPRGPLPDW